MRRALPVPVLVAAVVGAVLLTGGAYALLSDDNDTPRGEIVRLAAPEPGMDEPVCPEGEDFCLVRTETGLMRALYLYDTHQPDRERRCRVSWDPEWSFVDPVTGEEREGWFVSPCSGTLYELDGSRVFGPGQRNLDQFPLLRGDDEVEVNTGVLICGMSPQEEDCRFAPESS